MKIPGDSERKQKSSSSLLRAAVRDKVAVTSERRIYIHFPEKGSHRNHILGEVCIYSCLFLICHTHAKIISLIINKQCEARQLKEAIRAYLMDYLKE